MSQAFIGCCSEGTPSDAENRCPGTPEMCPKGSCHSDGTPSDVVFLGSGTPGKNIVYGSSVGTPRMHCCEKFRGTPQFDALTIDDDIVNIKVIDAIKNVYNVGPEIIVDDITVSDNNVDDTVEASLNIRLTKNSLNKVRKMNDDGTANDGWIDDEVISSVIAKDVIIGHPDRLLVSPLAFSQNEISGWGPNVHRNRLITIPKNRPAFEKAVIPVNRGGNHWTLAILNKNTKICNFYDTLGNGQLEEPQYSKLKLICYLLCNDSCTIYTVDSCLFHI